MTEQRSVTIQVPVLARVEGEGALDLRIENGQLDQVRLRIFEPPRLFEQFLVGREYRELPDLVARICGICPVAYQVTAVRAVERAFGWQAPKAITGLRRLFYCGEWLQSHSLHIHLLALPDFLGVESVAQVAASHADEVRRGLALQGLGNDIMRLFGGRSVHPIGLKVGGFHRLPEAAQWDAMRTRVTAARTDAMAMLRWLAGLPLPEQTQPLTCVALRPQQGYPIEQGDLAVSDGNRYTVDEYPAHFREHQEPWSSALYSTYHEKPYLVGPLARMNLNQDRLPAFLRALLDETGIRFPSNNVFHSILARAAEILVALDEAQRLLEQGMPTDLDVDPPTPCAGVAIAATEAPRGLLWQRYELDDQGLIRHARIVPPTSQNQAMIEQDLRASLEHFGLDRDEEELRLHAETVIRNYDPCISCATHFLRLRVQRPGEA